MNDEDVLGPSKERERRNARPPSRYVEYDADEALELINDSDENFSDFDSLSESSSSSSSSDSDDSGSDNDDTLYMLADQEVNQEVSQDDEDGSPLDWMLVPEDLYHGPLLVNEAVPYQWTDFENLRCTCNYFPFRPKDDHPAGFHSEIFGDTVPTELDCFEQYFTPEIRGFLVGMINDYAEVIINYLMYNLDLDNEYQNPSKMIWVKKDEKNIFSKCQVQYCQIDITY